MKFPLYERVPLHKTSTSMDSGGETWGFSSTTSLIPTGAKRAAC